MNKLKGSNPHDKFFRAAMGYQTIEEEFFRYLLPSAVTREVNLSSLALEPKNYISDDLLQHVAGILLLLDRLVEYENGVKFEKLVVEYLVQAGNITDGSEFVDVVIQCIPERVEGVAMTVAEYFEQKGMEKGELVGRQKERRQVALSMIKEGINVDLVAKVTDLTRREVDDLQHGEEEGAVLN